MLAPEYRTGLRALRAEIGLRAAASIGMSSWGRALLVRRHVAPSSDPAEVNKADLKNHFQLLANMYHMLERRYGQLRTDLIMKNVLLRGGHVYFRGFTPLGPGERLREFAQIYKTFERRNIVFDVLEENDTHFEIEIRRCLVFEAFNELGVPALTRWMCDIAFHYFSRYHPQMSYAKDRMIARGAATCHEVFAWHF
jgi:hypothetical protein